MISFERKPTPSIPRLLSRVAFCYSGIVKNNKGCVVESCGEVQYCKGLCNRHYRQQKAGRELTLPWREAICLGAGCSNIVRGSSGLCAQHYGNAHYERNRGYLVPSEKKRTKSVGYDGVPIQCSYEYCSRDRKYGGYCKTHYSQNRAGKDLLPIQHREACAVRECEALAATYKGFDLCRRHQDFARRFGLSKAECIAAWETRQCGNKACGATDDLVMDHDHACCPSKTKTCGKCNRGWLCRSCNLALGYVQDDVEKLEGLAEYIQRAPRVKNLSG